MNIRELLSSIGLVKSEAECARLDMLKMTGDDIPVNCFDDYGILSVQKYEDHLVEKFKKERTL